MKAARWCLTSLAVLLAVGCDNPTARKGSTSGASAAAGSSGTMGAIGAGAVGGTSGASGSGASGSGASSGAASSAGSSGSGSTGSCFPDGQFVGAGNAAQCCTGQVDANGYCGSGSTASTGSGSTGAGSTGAGSTGSCFPDGQFVGAGNASQCCSGQVDGQGYCGAGTTGSAGTTGTTGSSTTGGIFNGGWHPLDAGYTDAAVGDGGTTVLLDSTAPSNAPGQFGGPDDPSNKPTIVYPPDGVLVPPNMNSLEIHFLPGTGQTLFELSFHAAAFNVTIYTACKPLGSGCYYAPEQTFWDTLVQFARGQGPVSYTLRGVNGSSPGSVGTSVSRTIAFSDQDITAGIYYWNTAGTVQRYDWGYPGVAPETWMSASQAGASFCVGCHAFSRDGDKAVVGKDIPQPAAYSVYDVATRTKLTGSGGQSLDGSGNFFSFSPDGRYLLASDGYKIGWRDLSNGSTVNANLISSGTMPDWSPSGLDMVYAEPGSTPIFTFGGSPGVDSASLKVAHYNGSTWSAPSSLVPFQGENNYYPAYSPTGDWVVFDRSPGNHNSFGNAAPDPDAGTVPDGQLWTVSASGGNAIPLDTVNNSGEADWPKWAPLVSDYYGGHVMWLTFTSNRAYGLRLADGEKNQLWMVGFDADRAAAGLDPSFPAFYLPFQDSSGGNHIAQWVAKVVRPPCTSNSDCPTAQICTDGRCVPQVINHKAPTPKPSPARTWVREQAAGQAGAGRGQLSGWLGR